MYAIVEIAGQQFKVVKDQKLFVHRLEGKEGSKVTFDNVLLLANGEKISVGAPAIDGAQVGATVLKHFKGNKVIVFKKKRRKGYRVKNGHRQALTEILIENILTSGAKKAKAVEKPVKSVEKSAKKEVKTKTIEKNNIDLSKQTVTALKAMAKDQGVKGISSMKKDDLIKVLS